MVTELESGYLVVDDGLSFVGRIEAVGHTLVVGSHLQPESVLQLQVELTGFCLESRLTIEGGNDIITNDRLFDRMDAIGHVGHVYLWYLDNGLPVQFHVKPQFYIFAHGDRNPAVGRCGSIFLCFSADHRQQ